VGWKVWKARLSIQNFSNLRAGQTVTFKSPPGLTGCGELSGRRLYPGESFLEYIPGSQFLEYTLGNHYIDCISWDPILNIFQVDIPVIYFW
jgi:hypothetical protein